MCNYICIMYLNLSDFQANCPPFLRKRVLTISRTHLNVMTVFRSNNTV